MARLWELWLLIFRTLPMLVMDPRYLSIFLLVFIIVHGQYRRILIMERRMFGLVRSTPFRETVQSLGYGLVGGLAASVIFILLGISLTDTGIAYLWITSLLLMM